MKKKGKHILYFLLFVIPMCLSLFLFIMDRHDVYNITIGNWITYVAGLLTYYGTVILAVVTTIQNDRIIRIQEREQEVSERMLRSSEQPFFDIGYGTTSGSKIEPGLWQAEKELFHEYAGRFSAPNYSDIQFFLQCKNTDAHNIVFDYRLALEYYDQELDFQSIRKRIRNGEYIQFHFCFPNERNFCLWSFSFSYENIYGHKFYQKGKLAIAKQYEGEMIYRIGISDTEVLEKEISLGEYYSRVEYDDRSEISSTTASFLDLLLNQRFRTPIPVGLLYRRHKENTQ